MKETFYNHLLIYGQCAAIFLLTLLIAFIVNRMFSRFIKKSSEFMNNDPTNYQFLRHVIVGLIYLVGFSIALFTLPSFKTLASSLLTGAGILVVVAGFASQYALSNVVSGLFIVIFKPFRVNDRLTINNISGAVEDITLRHVVIRDLNNRRVVIPNSVISNDVIINADYKDERICRWITVGISYDSNIDLAKQIIQEIVENHPLNIDGRTPEQLEKGAPKVMTRVIALGQSSIDIRAWAWAGDLADAFVMECDSIEAIKKKFDEVGIEIPFQSHNIYLKGGQA